MLDIRNEMQFWTEILRDHAEFQFNDLAPSEIDMIQKTKNFMDTFEEFRRKVLPTSGVLTPEALAELIIENKIAVTQFVQFKIEIMQKLMTCSIKLAIPPSFINHMINEAMEYYRILSVADKSLRVNKALENIRLHKVWLPDASGHATHIASLLDAIETIYIKKAQSFEKRFDGLFKKAFEMFTMFERTGLEDLGLKQFNTDVEQALVEFIEFLDELKTLRKECRVYASGGLSELVPDHMIREENYYMYKVKTLET